MSFVSPPVHGMNPIIDPDPELGERCRERRQRYRELYRALRERFPRPG